MSRRRPAGRRLTTLATVAVGGLALLTGVSGVAVAGNWSVAVAANSSGLAQGATVTPLSLTASATLVVGTTALFPGAAGDVDVTLSNSNAAAVTVTGLTTPAVTTAAAAAFSDPSLTTPSAGCTAAASGTNADAVGWATGWNTKTGLSVVVPAASGGTPGTVTVILAGAVSMGSSSAAGCVGQYFKLPALTGITASVTGGATPTTPNSSVS